MASASGTSGNRVLLKNTYMVEYPPHIDVNSHFQTITNSLKTSKQIQDSEITIRHVISSSLFNGASFSVTTEDSIEVSKLLEDAIDIRAVYSIPPPTTFKFVATSDKAIDTDTNFMNAFELTGVDLVHNLQNFGAGVRVRKTQGSAVFISC